MEVNARMKTSVVIVDDHASVRQMLAVMLEKEGYYQVVAQGRTGFEGVHLCQQHRPHMLIVDLLLPEMSGNELIQQMRESMRELRILIYTGSVHKELAIEALRARPHGFVHKRDSLETFLEAARTVRQGGSYLTPFATRLLDESCGIEPSRFQMTARERLILQMVGEGLSSKEMAVRLDVTPKTVDHHRANLMQKLGVHDIAGLTRLAVRKGLVPLD